MTARTGSLCVGMYVLLALAAQARSAELGKVVSPTASLLSRGEDSWVALKQDAPVADDARLLALPGSRGEVQAKSFRLAVLGNVPEFDNFPVLESMVTFNRAKGADLDFNLNRGRLIIAKPKSDKELKVRARFLQDSAELVLPAEGAVVALEQYGRWPLGTPFKKTPGPKDAPFSVVSLFLVSGEITLKVGNEQHLVRAGSTFHWDNVAGADARPMPMEEGLPAWTKGVPMTAEAKDMQAAVVKFQGELARDSVAKGVTAALASTDPRQRELGVYALAALDMLPQLVAALGDAKNADVREDAINGLRHWMGQQADHPAELYRHFTSDLKYPETQGEIVLQLLHSFPDAERERPETFETMIEYLKHDKLAIRELGRAHLYRWVIAGRKIAYDAGSSPAEREEGYKAWKKLIPSGKLPPKAEKP